ASRPWLRRLGEPVSPARTRRKPAVWAGPSEYPARTVPCVSTRPRGSSTLMVSCAPGLPLVPTGTLTASVSSWTSMGVWHTDEPGASTAAGPRGSAPMRKAIVRSSEPARHTRTATPASVASANTASAALALGKVPLHRDPQRRELKGDQRGENKPHCGGLPTSSQE